MKNETHYDRSPYAIVNNIELPKNCHYCDFSVINWETKTELCFIKKKKFEENYWKSDHPRFPSWCPLIDKSESK